jgi:hypothetical protein
MMQTIHVTKGCEEKMDDTTAGKTVVPTDEKVLLLDGAFSGLPYSGAACRLLARRRRRDDQRRRRRRVG